MSAVNVNNRVVSSQKASRTVPRPEGAELLQLPPVAIASRHIAEPRNKIVQPVEGPSVTFVLPLDHPCIMPLAGRWRSRQVGSARDSHIYARRPGRRQPAYPRLEASHFVVLPADDHVHSEWSWDAPGGSMERSCTRALELGLPSVAFTEHADYTTWTLPAGALDDHEHLKAFLTSDVSLAPPALDLDGYLETVQRCRDLFPELRIISGVELGEPHWHSGVAASLLEAGEFDRVLGSQHCLPFEQGFCEVADLYARRPAADVVREYLAEIPRLISGSDAFAVLAHIDYAVRDWPAPAGPFDPKAFRDEFRHALRVLADSDRALEVNTRGQVHPEIIRWWHEEGGKAITFGSDAHEPTALAHGFREAMAVADAAGFRPGRHPHDFWTRWG